MAGQLLRHTDFGAGEYQHSRSSQQVKRVPNKMIGQILLVGLALIVGGIVLTIIGRREDRRLERERKVNEIDKDLERDIDQL